jgi:cholesterol oxidase
VTRTDRAFDFDWIVVGSGFGGSVAALRLAEKGYRVGVLEAGRRFADEDFCETTWQLSRYYWLPVFGLRGILRLSLFKDIVVVSGCGVGGGSLGYANTLYRARPRFYADPRWAGLADWEAELRPHYEEAERMLGVVAYDRDTPADALLKAYADENGVGATYAKTRVGVFLGEAGKTVGDPYFGGAGPDRRGCIECGACMTGCRHNAKNTLVKNYLWFAERLGVEIRSERTVTDLRPLGAADGRDGYAVTHERSGGILRRERGHLTARGVVVAAGALGTNRLLFRAKLAGSLPRLSDRLGHAVRTNSESILAVTAPDDAHDFTNGIAITSSIYPKPEIHIEPVTYGRGADSQSLLFWLMTEAGRRGTQPLHLLLNVARHPSSAVRAMRVRAWSRRTVIVLCMQTADSLMRLKVARRWPNGNPILTTEQDPSTPNPDKVPEAYELASWLADRLGGTPQASFTEASLAIPTTAHILGGAAIGGSAETGVVDSDHRAFGYENLLVCDGAAIPANLGVNPSLTITALAERAMSRIPPPGPARPTPARSEAAPGK